MANSVNNLNAKEQFILRQALTAGCFNSLLRYDYDFLAKWNKTFKTNADQTSDATWTRIQTTMKGMLDKNIFSFKTGHLSAELSPSGRQLKTRTYHLKTYWKTQNNVELKEFFSKIATRAQRSDIKAKNRKS